MVANTAFKVSKRDEGLTFERAYRHSPVDQAALVVLGLEENREWIWLYHPDHGLARCYLDNFNRHFRRV